MRRRVVIAVCAITVALTGAALPATAATTDTIPAGGTFSFTTGNGILPTWTADDIVIIGVSPGSVTTAPSNLFSRISMPIVAKTGSANAAAGGFRLYNSTTGQSVRCSTPTIDTRARVIDCVLPGGKNAALFSMKSIRTRSVITGSSTVTTIYRGIVLRINGQAMADLLNDSLSISTFSPYVTVGTGDLIVTVDR
ncbi:MAG: hypothetical protein IPO93_05200 [Actinobacteria bacterium]|jgi:hypothetical protein|nr:hypothetical protein [Actinomycetota bacterium]